MLDSGKGKTMVTVKRSGCQWLEGREGWKGGAQGIFKTGKLLYDTVMVPNFHLYIVQSHRIHNTKNES